MESTNPINHKETQNSDLLLKDLLTPKLKLDLWISQKYSTEVKGKIKSNILQYNYDIEK